MRAAAVIVLSLLFTSEASAMTGTDFNRLDGEQSASYLGGAVDMLAYVLATQSQGVAAKCLQDWWFRGPGPEQMIATVKAHPELPVEGILQAVVRRLCVQAK